MFKGKMPYKLSCNKDGCYVINKETGEKKNKKRMPKSKAKKYMKALYHAESGAEFTKKEETMQEFFEQFIMSNKSEETEKEASLDDKLNHIRDEIRKKLNPKPDPGAMVDVAEPYYWVQSIYENYAIVEKDGKHYRVDWLENGEGGISISGLSEVEQNWIPVDKEKSDLLISFEEDSGSDHLMVFKEKSGDYRWIMFSSNAFQDRDGEIISLKALTDDVARADEDGQYGPLRWWHIGDPDPATKSAGPGLDIGDCDFNAMHGKILIESGTFRDQEVGSIVSEKASELQGSILFFHPKSEPDDEGIFHNIYRAERSLLPKGKASNSLVSLLVSTKESEMSMIAEKVKKFIATLGGDEKKVQEALEKAELTEKDAEALGIAWKGGDPDPEGEPAGEEPEGEEPEGDDPEGDDPEGDDPEGDEKSFLGNMTSKQFQELQGESLKGVIEPLGVQLKEIQTAQAKVDDTQISLKEAVDNQSKRLEGMDKRLKELEGETPRGRDGYRPSQDDDTVISDDHTLKGVKPEMDPDFMQFVLPGEGSG